MDLAVIEHADKELLLLINHFRSPTLDVLMPVLSDFKMLLPILIPFLAWRFWKGDRRERLMWAGAVIAVAASDLICARIIKTMVGRPRPYEMVTGLYLFKHSRWILTDPAYLAGVSNTLAWPSCHAMNMWTAASYITAWQGMRGLAVMALAVLVCWSRLYLGMHYPLDVLGGALIGVLLGSAACRAATFLISRYTAE